MKRKGFTLIELLAVIVILSVIALIATPMIMNVIEEAKIKSSEQSVNGYLDAVEKQVIIGELEEQNQISDGLYTLPMSNVEVKGNKPTNGWVIIQDGEVINYSVVMNEYVVTKNSETVKGNKISGAIKEEASSTDTYKGIVYLDPTDLNKTCTKEMAENNLNEKGTPTEIKTGCMKWYIYDEDDNNYTMILDHNTTARIKWNDDNKNVSYEESNLYSVVQDLKTTSGWVVNPRIISAEEVNTITGKTGFDSTNTNSWYYVDSKTHTQTSKIQGASKYAWIFDYTYECISSGCNISDNNSYTGYETAVDGQTYSYWTSTTVVSSTSIWIVYRNGNLTYNYANRSSTGIRPVITIPKSIIG